MGQVWLAPLSLAVASWDVTANSSSTRWIQGLNEHETPCKLTCFPSPPDELSSSPKVVSLKTRALTEHLLTECKHTNGDYDPRGSWEKSRFSEGPLHPGLFHGDNNRPTRGQGIHWSGIQILTFLNLIHDLLVPNLCAQVPSVTDNAKSI